MRVEARMGFGTELFQPHKSALLQVDVVIAGETGRYGVVGPMALEGLHQRDYDGDESNLHVPATLEAIAECKYLSSARYRLISPQSSKANLSIVQDSLLGAFRMTCDPHPLSKSEFMDISLCIPVYNDIKAEYDAPARRASPQWIFQRLTYIKSIYIEILQHHTELGELNTSDIDRIRRLLGARAHTTQFDPDADQWIYTGKTLFSLALPSDFN